MPPVEGAPRITAGAPGLIVAAPNFRSGAARFPVR